MGLLATLLPSHARPERLERALRDRHTLVECEDWKTLLATCARRAVSVALVDLFPTPGAEPAYDDLRQLRRRFPSVTVVLYTATPPARSRDLFEAGRFGFDGLIIADLDDEPRRFRTLLDQAEARGVMQLLRPALTNVRPTVRDALLLAVTRAHQNPSPDEVARILGIRRKLLSQRLGQSGFPTAKRLIAWGRLIVAARLLEDVERSADSVARALNYPSGSTFRNACQRYVQATPHEIRARGGAQYVVAALLAQARARPDADAGAGATPASRPPSAPP